MWSIVQSGATTATARSTMLRLKCVINKEFDMPPNLPWANEAHPMYLYARNALDVNRERLRTNVREKLESDEAARALLDTLMESTDAEVYIRMTNVLRRFRNWRSVLVDADSDSDE